MKKSRKENPRIFHGLANICGIGRNIADWQREEKKASADFFVYKDNPFFQNGHVNLHFEKKNVIQRSIERIILLSKSIRTYDIFHFYFGKSLFPLNLDLPILRLYGKIVLMEYFGSEIRLTKIEKNRNPYYHLRETENGYSEGFDFLKKARMFWQGIWMHLCFAQTLLYKHALSSIPEKKINQDLWVGTTINVPDEQLQVDPGLNVTIYHAPTDRIRKGSDYVEKAVEELKAEGLQFEFHVISNLPHDELLLILETKADIVVDQLLSGGFGILAMEAMSCGRPVCGYVMPEVRNAIPDLPIVQCTIDTLKDNLRELILNKEKREKIGKASWEFAKKQYDRDTIYEELWQIYLNFWHV